MKWSRLTHPSSWLRTLAGQLLHDKYHWVFRERELMVCLQQCKAVWLTVEEKARWSEGNRQLGQGQKTQTEER